MTAGPSNSVDGNANADIANSFNLCILNTEMKELTTSQIRSESDLQRFDSLEWSSIHYADVKKKYLRSPSFTDLEANVEVSSHDTSKVSCNMEKAIASISFALLKQREALEREISYVGLNR